MTDQELIDLNRKGFIPGPGESEAAFNQRVWDSTSSIPRAHLAWVQEILCELFDFEPHSLDVFYANQNLAPWQGAACWIDRGKCRLQLREAFKKGSYLKLYQREEVLAHEAVHAARMAFNEPENEEFFAYATSEKKWRQVLGPILKHPWEVWLFIFPLALSLFWSEAYLLLLLIIGAGFWRLIKQHRIRAKAAKNLLNKVQDAKKVRAILFRMTDLEIRELAKGKWVEGDDSLRWRLIRAAYFNVIGSFVE